MFTKCQRVLSHVNSTPLSGSVNWPWSVAMIDKVRAWETKILRLTFRPRMKPEETWVGYRKRTAQSLRKNWRKMGLPLLTGVENDRVVEKPDLLEHGVGLG